MTNGWHYCAKAVNEPGLRIRQKFWKSNEYIWFDGNQWREWTNHPATMRAIIFDADDWQFYKEPAKEPKTVTKLLGEDSAFPGTDNCLSAGLTKREYFAAKALQGFSANDACNEWSSRQIARVSVELADALIKSLEDGEDG